MNNVPEPRKRTTRISVLLERIKVGLLGEKIADLPQSAGKRIVSKKEYVRVQTKQVQKAIPAVLSFAIGSLCVALALLSLVSLVVWNFRFLSLFLALFSGVGAYVFLVRAIATFNQWENVEVVPLTRANLADLPVPDSLVRASQEPMQAQETMLLRASTAGQEKHEEQLLRAAAGEQEQA